MIHVCILYTSGYGIMRWTVEYGVQCRYYLVSCSIITNLRSYCISRLFFHSSQAIVTSFSYCFFLLGIESLGIILSFYFFENEVSSVTSSEWVIHGHKSFFTWKVWKALILDAIFRNECHSFESPITITLSSFISFLVGICIKN